MRREVWLGVTPNGLQLLEPVAQPVVAWVAEPSFKCAGAKNVDEQLVCGDFELAGLDVEMAHLFGLATAAGRQHVEAV